MASVPGPKTKPLPSRPLPAAVMQMMVPRVVKAKLNGSGGNSGVVGEVSVAGSGSSGDRSRKRNHGWDNVVSVPVQRARVTPVPASSDAGLNEFTVTVDMGQKQLLGIDVDWADGKTLYIKSVQPGAVEDWNREHSVQFAVCAGDRVVAANGISGDVHAMVQECRARRELKLVIRTQREHTIARTQPKDLPKQPHRPTSIESAVPASKPSPSVGDSLYAGMPAPDPVKDKTAGARAKELDIFAGPPAAEDARLVVFLDIDGVLRIMDGCPTISVDGELLPLDLRSRAFVPEAMRALRFLIHRTGAGIVISSEWRRDATLREEVATALRALGLPVRGMTQVFTPRDDIVLGTLVAPDKEGTLILRWAERRAREITAWLLENPEVEQWVALDDLDLSRADDTTRQVRLADTLRMAPNLVLCDPEVGFTMSHARTAIEMLLRCL